METLIDDNGNALPPKSCLTCRFMVQSDVDPKTLTRAYKCMWGPPQLVLMPAGPQGMALVAMHVQVNVNMWCHRHEPFEPAN